MNYLQAPDMVTWEITEKCNMHCKHCSNAVDGCYIELPTSLCKKIIDRLVEANVFKVGIEGGEPFCRNDLLELIDYMNNFYLSPSIATNGTLINEDVILELKKRQIDALQFSLDGSSSWHYSRLRNNGNCFDLVISNIKRAVQHGLPVSIAMVISKSTFHDIPNMAALAHELGVAKLRFIDFIPSGRGSIEECLSKEEYEDVCHMINAINIYGLTVVAPSKIMSLINGNTRNTLINMINPSECFGCEAGLAIAHIRANGDLTPCSFFREDQFVAGNILEKPLSDIWLNSVALRPFREYQSVPSKCLQCDRNHECMGGCRAYAYYSTGNLESEDLRCWR